jgi:uncharacterized Ntn-hydrolase superfamily protein
MMERDLEAVAERAAVAALAAMMPKLTGVLVQELRSLSEMNGNPVSPHCERVLAALDKGQIKCWDFRGTRSAAMCLAFKIMEEEKLSRLPVGRAWQVLREKCTM